MPGPGSPGRGRRGGGGDVGQTSGRRWADLGQTLGTLTSSRELHPIFNSPKKWRWGAIWCPKCSKVTPKASKMEPWTVILMTFFCKKPTLHPTAYLLCFRHILGVLGSPVWKKILLEMCVGSRSPKKAVTLSLFLIFRRKCVKMGAQMGGEIRPKNRPFSHWSTFGCPWVHFP